jgi:hypothetical protein
VDSTKTAAGGYALSPKGAADMRTVLEALIGDTQGAVTGLEPALRALIAEEVAKCLKLSGGTMAGAIVANVTDIIASNASNSSLRVHGGKALNDGASVIVYGKDHPSMAGRVQLCARNGVAAENNDLVIGPNGYCALKGNSIFTSAGGSVGKLVGTGELVFVRDVDSNRLWISGGKDMNSGALILYGKDHAEYANEARLKAGNTQLRVLPAGGAILGGYKVLTEASGTASVSAALAVSSVVVGDTTGKTFTLPAVGTWAYTYHRASFGDNAGGSGIAAGGTTVTAAEGPTSYFAIRIA